MLPPPGAWAPPPVPPGRCQHCERDITALADGRTWVDSDGLAYCMKRVGANVALLHHPLPVIR